ncbi:putative transcription factor MYB/SANT family [Dioscorea sansibarensis]
MDLIEMNYNDEVLNQEQGCSPESNADHLLSLESPGEEDIYEQEPIVLPRLGDAYQAEVPPLMSESERLQLSCKPVDINSAIAADYSIGMGLDFPVMWSYCSDEQTKHEQQEIPGTATSAAIPVSVDYTGYGEDSICPEANKMVGFLPVEFNSHASLPQGTTFKSEHPEGTLASNKELDRCVRQESATTVGHIDVSAPLQQPGKGKCCCALPVTPSVSWTSAESQSFLLGLYIFGKNLAQIRKFMGSKGMGDILSYYYGKFYKSDAHRRWTEGRKIRSRRCIHGARILTGWRQQEFLSRLLPSMKDAQDTLLEASRAFNEGRVSLEEFVLSLKAMVSMEVLVQAVGIGQGKRDLTRVVLDPTKTNPAASTRSDLPTGKACSSLTTEDIVKFLTGNFRLSKARSNDLFWEAVWPRLLARGWHSEQPKDIASVGSKNILVFLTPGIKKFSRRKLVKGNQYFDSVTDVLNKVASDPSLIELEVEGNNASGNTKDEDGWDANAQMKQNSFSDHQRHCYLRPKVPHTSEVMKFTIVDTSLDPGIGPKKVRELRSLPVDACQIHPPPICSAETYSDSSSSGRSESDQLPVNDEEESNPGLSETSKMGNKRVSSFTNGQSQSDVSDHMSVVPKQRMPMNGHDSNGRLDEFFDVKQPFKVTKSQSNWSHDYLAPAVKKRRLTACKQSESKHHSSSFPQGYQLKREEMGYETKLLKPSESITGVGVGPSRINSFNSFQRGYHVKKEETSSDLKSLERTESMSSVATDPSRRKFSISLPEKSVAYHSSGTFFSNTSISKTVPHLEKPQPQTLIDLNVPYLPPDIKVEEQHHLYPVQSSSTSETKQQPEGPQVSADTSNDLPGMQPSTVSVRRHSTRSRPLTTKALEALASGYLSSCNRKGRGGNPSRSSRRARRNVGTPVAAPAPAPAPAPTDSGFRSSGLVSDVEMKDKYKAYTTHPSIYGECPDQAKGKADQDMVGAFSDFH